MRVVRRWRWGLVGAALVVVLAGQVSAEIALELVDGRTLRGPDVERVEGFYLLTLDGGDIVPIDERLVRQIRLSGVAERPSESPAVAVAAPRTLSGRDADLPAPPPEVLAGRETALPRRPEQLAAFEREPARFRSGVIDPVWRPTSDWTLALENNEFNPTRWAVDLIDPIWVPTPAYTQATDVTEFNPARWSESPIDPSWEPADGFAVAPVERRSP